MTEPVSAGVGAATEPTIPQEPVTTDDLAGNQALIDRIASMIPDDNADPAMVTKILAALDQAKKGAPLNTMCRNPETGATATRISRDGMHMWSIIGGNGIQSFDMQPELPGAWVCVFRPGESV